MVTYAVVGLHGLSLGFEWARPLETRRWIVESGLGVRNIGYRGIAHMNSDSWLGDLHSSLELLASKACEVCRCDGGCWHMRFITQFPLV